MSSTTATLPVPLTCTNVLHARVADDQEYLTPVEPPLDALKSQALLPSASHRALPVAHDTRSFS